MPVQLNGIAHIYLTVSDFDACLPFYEKLLEFFEMQCLVKTDELYYCVGGRTGLGIRRASAEHRNTPFDPYRSGLHHLCFRARSREDVDRVHDFVTRLGARIVHPPREDDWAPGYYSVLFADPGGTRLEVNFVPGKGKPRSVHRAPAPAPAAAAPEPAVEASRGSWARPHPAAPGPHSPHMGGEAPGSRTPAYGPHAGLGPGAPLEADARVAHSRRKFQPLRAKSNN